MPDLQTLPMASGGDRKGMRIINPVAAGATPSAAAVGVADLRIDQVRASLIAPTSMIPHRARAPAMRTTPDEDVGALSPSGSLTASGRLDAHAESSALTEPHVGPSASRRGRGVRLAAYRHRNPDYFHKVVDCQWACPAHTPVPEYIRLIAAGRYADAFMVNWYSNVFPGILGRTCDRPCEPACRRGRVEEEPVAICRLKRVAADYKGDITPPPAPAPPSAPTASESPWSAPAPPR